MSPPNRERLRSVIEALDLAYTAPLLAAGAIVLVVSFPYFGSI